MQLPPSSPRSPIRVPRRKTLLQRRTSRKPARSKQAPDERDSRLKQFKPWLDAIQGVATILVALAGGFWFMQQRLNKPNIRLEQTVTHRILAKDADHKSDTLITLEVTATNIGKVGVTLAPSTAEIIQLNPIPERTQDATMRFPLKPMQLEPGESDQAIFKTVTIPSFIQTIEVHSQYAVPNCKILSFWCHTKNYWSVLRAVDIGVGEAGTEAASSMPHS